MDPGTSSSPVWVDALNVAYWCGSPPQLRIPMTVDAALRTRNVEVHLCFDASGKYQFPEPDRDSYLRLLTGNAHWHEVPSGSSADLFLLERAKESGGCIVSRDRYREHRKSFRKVVHGPGRLVSGHVEDERLCIPALGIDEALVHVSAPT